jgi:hypothetical protein
LYFIRAFAIKKMKKRKFAFGVKKSASILICYREDVRMARYDTFRERPMNTLFDISTPQKRERFLLIVAGFVFAVIAIPILYSLFGTQVSNLQKQRDKLRGDIEKYENEAKRKIEVKNRLAVLTNQSLPSRDDFALSLYQTWLMELANDVGLKEYKIDSGTVPSKKKLYTQFTFTLQGKGKLGQIAELLRRFHRTEYLHLIRSVAPRPTKNRDEFDVTFKVEALSLPQARTNRTLPPIDKESTAVTEAETAMLKTISDRAIFAEYSPPRSDASKESEKPKPNEFDYAAYCFVTSIVEADGKPQVWVSVRTDGKLYKLFVGEMFKLGDVRCFVRKIDFDRVRFEAAGGFYTVRIGKSFSEWEE